MLRDHRKKEKCRLREVPTEPFNNYFFFKGRSHVISDHWSDFPQNILPFSVWSLKGTVSCNFFTSVFFLQINLVWTPDTSTKTYPTLFSNSPSYSNLKFEKPLQIKRKVQQILTARRVLTNGFHRHWVVYFSQGKILLDYFLKAKRSLSKFSNLTYSDPVWLPAVLHSSTVYRGPAFDSRGPAFDSRGPAFDSRGRHSIAEGRHSIAEGRHSIAEVSIPSWGGMDSFL